jgi:hypothetical protein
MSAPRAARTQNAEINALKSKIYEQEQVIRALTNEIVRLNGVIDGCANKPVYSAINTDTEPSTADTFEETVKKHINTALDDRITRILNEKYKQIVNTYLDNSLDKRIENKIHSELCEITKKFIWDTDSRIMGTINSTCRDYINDYLDEMLDERLECLLKDRLRVIVDKYLDEILDDMVRDSVDNIQDETYKSIKELDERLDGLEINLNDEIDGLRIDFAELKNKYEGGSVIKFESDSTLSEPGSDKEDRTDINDAEMDGENNETINETRTAID